MNIQKLTQRSTEVIQNARAAALEYGNPQIDQEHLAYALFSQDGGLIPELLKKLGTAPDIAVSETETLIKKLPKISGTSEVYVSRDLELSLNAAEKRAEEMRDEYISVEHLMLGLLDKPGSSLKTLFKSLGINSDDFLRALAVFLNCDNVSNLYKV